MAKIKIGFYLSYNVGSLKSQHGNVLGDELYATSLAKALQNISSDLSVDVYAPNNLPDEILDVMIYMNDNHPDFNLATKSILYLQNAYGNGSYEKLKELRSRNYDGYAFISNRLSEIHANDGFSGIFLPFGVDLTTFYPRSFDPELSFDVAYVGNDIKGAERSAAYLEPAADYQFGLFGNWAIPRARFRIWKNWGLPQYKYKFEKIGRGKIPQELVPVLYSSSKINLNCTAQDCVDWDVITLRTLEVLACGGFLISDRVPSAERLLGEYIVFTDGYQDLRSKIDYYLDDESARKAMASAGCSFVQENFSIQSVASKLLAYINEG